MFIFFVEEYNLMNNKMIKSMEMNREAKSVLPVCERNLPGAPSKRRASQKCHQQHIPCLIFLKNCKERGNSVKLFKPYLMVIILNQSLLRFQHENDLNTKRNW